MNHKYFNIIVIFTLLVMSSTLYAQPLTVDVVPDFSTMSWVDIDGSGGPPAPANFPSPGEPFIIEGDIFAANTTSNPIGTYLCRGWFITPQPDGDGTYVSQSFEIDGDGTIYVQGNEPGITPGVNGVRRAIVGATGSFKGFGQAAIGPHPTSTNPIAFRVTFHFNQGNVEALRSEESSAALEQDKAQVIADMELKQNYPNPFNPETEISFKLQKPSRVVVKIFNTLGQEVRTLSQQQYEAGSHTLQWDGKDNLGNAVSSGVYLYRLEVEGFSVVKKMSLMR